MIIHDLSYLVDLGRKIVEKEMALRRKIVSGKSTRENIRITAELTRIGDFYRDYLLRRLFQRQVEQNIQKSLKKSNNKTAKMKRQKRD